MSGRWESFLGRWVEAGLVSPEDAERIRAWEAKRTASHGPGWPVLLALGFGALTLGAGVLLFVAAHWDELSPGARFGLVLSMIAAFHAGGAAASERFPALATALHATGTVSLGAGIALAAQIFNLEEHWPGGVLLWAAGAWTGFLLLRDWPQAALAAVLTPAWLASERVAAIERSWEQDSATAQGLLLLAFVYLTARAPGKASSTRRVLTIIGMTAITPLLVYVFNALDDPDPYYYAPMALPRLPGARNEFGVPGVEFAQSSAWAIALALALPVALGFVLRGRGGFIYLIGAAWTLALNAFDTDEKYELLGLLFWCLLAAALLVACGVRDRRRPVERAGLLGIAAGVIGLLSWAH